jgi:hypothetical protein
VVRLAQVFQVSACDLVIGSLLMKSAIKRTANIGVTLGVVLSALGAQAQSQALRERSHVSRPGTFDLLNESGPLTGKERLGRKWTDEQRIDNCNVPIDKRGAQPRPSDCVHAPTI